MKKITLLAISLALTCTSMLAQQEKGIIGYNNWLNPWTEFQPNKVDYGEPTQILSGTITEDLELNKQDVYLLLGDVFVTDSTTLSIEAGTVIVGDFKTKGSLTINKGSKIIANGSYTDPIIFTSSRKVKKPGDWGGLFILGDAPTNYFGSESALNYGLDTNDLENLNYGGDNPDSDSGILTYIRIEFAGKRTKDYGYFNGLTLAGVGQQTILENIMVSYCEGNSFSILGGDVILERMVSYKSSINDYEFNYGAQCRLRNSLAIKSPYVSGADTSRCMYVNAYDKLEDVDATQKQTYVNAENLTLINLSDDLDNDIRVGLVNESIFIGKNAAFSIDKSVISGFNPAVVFDSKTQIDSERLDNLKFTRTYFNNCNGNIYIKYKPNNEDLENWYGNRAFNNVYSKGPDSETFINSNDPKQPDFRLRINRIIASND